ncbi:MAG: lytic transglycosylase domain-containing protein [Coriobacteriia bacterium]|nr:lytic transglycosylase domain-containing protein [Coriobacteriia bacterium]
MANRSVRPQEKAKYRPSILTSIGLFLLVCVFILGTISVATFHGPIEVKKSYYPLKYEEFIQQSSDRHTISPYLIAAIIKAESNWNPEGTSRVGAQGLMQLMPETAQDIARMNLVDTERFKPDKLQDPETNIEYGTAYMRYLINRYHELEPAIAAYNAGFGNVDRWMENGRDIRDTIEFPETQQYLLKVVRAKKDYEQIYPDRFSRR